jgi:carbamoyl-phosphate synthase large subunit
VINIPKSSREDELTNDYLIRRRAVDFGVPLITDISLAQRFVETIARKSRDDLLVKSSVEYQVAPTAPSLPQSRVSVG